MEKEMIKIQKIPLLIVGAMFLGVLFIALSNSLVSADLGSTYLGDLSSSSQYYSPGFNYYTTSQIQTYWAEFGREECRAREDLILNIPPAGCTPTVVRSDLLEEQPVPVFCEINAIKINPLIDVEAIRSVSFKGQYPEGVAGVSFHPARAAIRSYNTLLGSPLMNNAGYLVVVLKQMPEKDMPEYVEGNLTAVIRYDVEKAFGVGKAEFVLPVLTESEWERDYEGYGFWRGKGFLRANWVDEQKASISVYRDSTHKDSTVILEKGKTSEDIYLGGMYCAAAMNVQVKEISVPQTMMKLSVSREGSDDVLWLYEGNTFLDGKCRVLKIQPDAFGGGSADLRCSGKTFTLFLGSSDRVKLSVDGEEVVKELWEPIASGNSKVYAASTGSIRLATSDGTGRAPYVVLVKTTSEITDSIKEQVLKETDRKIRSYINSHAGGAGNLADINKELENIKIDSVSLIQIALKDAEADFDNKKILFIGPGGAFDKDYLVSSDGKIDPNGKELEEYFTKTINEYRDVVQLYSAEEDANGEYGLRALEQAAVFAGELGKQKTQQELLNELIERYPDSKEAVSAKNQLSILENYNTGNSIVSFSLLDEFYTAQLQDIREPSLDDASAEIILNNDKKKIGINEYASPPVGETGKQEYLLLKELNENYALFSYSYNYTEDGKVIYKKGEEKIEVGKTASLGKFEVYVSDINLKKVAIVSLDPKMKLADTETTLSFKIGIEKRSIELSPDRVRKMLANLNETIEDWESIINKLGSVVKAWKGTCFATSAILIVKNLLDNFSGKSMARSKVMRGPGGWVERCKEMVDKGENNYVTLDQCLLGEAPNIEKEVSASQKVIQAVNKRVQEQEVASEKTIFGEKVLNTEASFNKFMGSLTSEELNQKFKVYDDKGNVKKDDKGKEIEFTFGNLTGGNYGNDYKEGVYTYSDVREWMYYDEMMKSDVSDKTKEAYAKELSGIYERISSRRKDLTEVGGYKPDSDIGGGIQMLEGGKKVVTNEIVDLEGSDLKKFETNGNGGISDITGKNSWIRVHTPSTLKFQGSSENDIITAYSGKVFLVPLKKNGDTYSPDTDKGAYVLTSEGGKEKITESVSKDNLTKILNSLDVSGFIRVEKGQCKYPYKNPQVRFFDVEPYRDMPGVVPFDKKEGWYAGLKQTIKGFGLTPYTDAGIVKNFYLCNVGKNGREEFDSGLGDDICSFISFETGATASHPCLDDTEARKMADKARNAIRVAAEQKARGAKKIQIFGESYDVGLPVGGAEGTQCQDFMSPQDCWILFNACDPVLCPTSRCDLGGNYPVRDVIQSGIIGSIALCFPNIREKIMVPVCLTGIHAGLDAYVSILKAERDCLEANLETGDYVGICDEVTSVYKCEFFWRQLAPLTNLALPKIVELFYGQGTRGGGEYLTVQHAWNTADNSVKYLTEFYAQNSYNAFLKRSTDEAGTEICNSFISARYPASGDFFDALLEPDSPVQYHARFDEIPFTEATIPATSHYKVYYHIWAGNDQGTQYSVYLKEPPESSYYASIPTLLVDTGYIGKGQYADKTKDFTAPAGYKKLCVRVNTQEECGFGQVSTSFAADYIQEEYLAEQASQEVQTEKECMSGTPSLLPLLTPNAQEGIQEAVQPEIYNRGIIRVCATDNPGKQTNPERWKDVGYCGDDKLRCWIDMQSVQTNINNNLTRTAVETAVGDMSKQVIEELVDKGIIMSEEETASKLGNSKKSIEKLTSEYNALKNLNMSNAESLISTLENKFDDVFENLQDIQDRGFSNAQKAEAILLRSQVYEFITDRIKKKFFPDEIKPETANNSSKAKTESFSTTSGKESTTENTEATSGEKEDKDNLSTLILNKCGDDNENNCILSAKLSEKEYYLKFDIFDSNPKKLWSCIMAKDGIDGTFTGVYLESSSTCTNNLYPVLYTDSTKNSFKEGLNGLKEKGYGLSVKQVGESEDESSSGDTLTNGESEKEVGVEETEEDGQVIEGTPLKDVNPGDTVCEIDDNLNTYLVVTSVRHFDDSQSQQIKLIDNGNQITIHDYIYVTLEDYGYTLSCNTD